MKVLKTILVSVFVILIILLLLILLRCGCRDRTGNRTGDRLGEQPGETVIQPTPPGRDSLVEEADSVPQGVVIKEKFKADVVMCIDCTGSMESIINTIKSNAQTFYSDLKRKSIEQGKEISSMRIKVIGFRDFDREAAPFEVSDFFELPAGKGGFSNFVSRLSPNGGGDEPELGYDALAQAVNSDWKTGNDIHQVIILWTDASSHPLSGKNGVPRSFSDLKSMWNDKMNSRGKHLFLFAPADPTWTNLESALDRTIRHDVSAGGGLSDLDYEEILETLSESI